MKDDSFFLLVIAVAIVATIAVSSVRTNRQPDGTATIEAARQANARPQPEVRQIQSITVVGRRSDGDLPADQLAATEHDNR